MAIEETVVAGTIFGLDPKNSVTRWAQETQNVAAKSVFKMAGGYFPRGGRGQITFLLC